MPNGSWKARLTSALVLAAGLTALILLADGLAGPPALQPQASPTVVAGVADIADAADAAHAVEHGQTVANVEAAGVCRMRPECDKNADCDERCGAGLGRCVRSHCPIRVCRCG